MVNKQSCPRGRVHLFPALLAAFLAWSWHPPACAQTGGQDIEVFRNVADEIGLHFDHVIPLSGEYYFPEQVGGGVALLDYDGDGCLDVLVLQAGKLDPSHPDPVYPPGFKPGVRLFHNDLCQTGKLHFTDVTEQAGINIDMPTMGIAVADYDGSGWPSIYITGYRRNVLLHNNGNGTFTDVTAKAGVAGGKWSTSAAFCELRGNRLLDLVVANYVDYDYRTNKKCNNPSGARDYCGPQVYRPVPMTLYRNNGDGTFTDATKEAGLDAAFGAGLGVSCGDLAGEGRVDIFVANDGNANQLWRNRGDGTFEDIALLAGVAYSANGSAQAGMGVAIADYQRRGRDDIYVTNMVGEGNNLYRPEDQGIFRDVARERGLLAPSLPMTGFGVVPIDIFNDGHLGLFVANGAVSKINAKSSGVFPYEMQDQLFRNAGQGFVDISNISGPALRLLGVGRGVAVGDLNNDGATDLVVTHINGPLRVLMNQVAQKRHWLMVRLEATSMNREGLGARVGIPVQDGKVLWRNVRPDGSFLSSSDRRVHFGLGDTAAPQSIIVKWLNAPAEIWRNVVPDQIILLKQGTGARWEQTN